MVTTCYNIKYKFNKNTHSLTSQHTHTHARTHTHLHACTNRHMYSMYASIQVREQEVWVRWEGRATIGSGNKETKKFRSLVHGLRGTVWFGAEFWTGILLQHSVQGMGVYAMWQLTRAQTGKSALLVELFLSFCYPKSAGVSRGTWWTGWDVQVKQIRQVRRSSFWDYVIIHGRDYISFFELLEASAA